MSKLNVGTLPSELDAVTLTCLYELIYTRINC